MNQNTARGCPEYLLIICYLPSFPVLFPQTVGACQSEFIAPQVGWALWRACEMTSACGRWHLSAMACELVFAARLLVLQNFSCSLATIAPWPKKQTKKKTKQCHFIFVYTLYLLAIGGYEFQCSFVEWLEQHRELAWSISLMRAWKWLVSINGLFDFIDESANMIVIDGLACRFHWCGCECCAVSLNLAWRFQWQESRTEKHAKKKPQIAPTHPKSPDTLSMSMSLRHTGQITNVTALAKSPNTLSLSLG